MAELPYGTGARRVRPAEGRAGYPGSSRGARPDPSLRHELACSVRRRRSRRLYLDPPGHDRSRLGPTSAVRGRKADRGSPGRRGSRRGPHVRGRGTPHLPAARQRGFRRRAARVRGRGRSASHPVVEERARCGAARGRGGRTRPAHRARRVGVAADPGVRAPRGAQRPARSRARPRGRRPARRERARVASPPDARARAHGVRARFRDPHGPSRRHGSAALRPRAARGGRRDGRMERARRRRAPAGSVTR